MRKLEFQKTEHHLGGFQFTSYKPLTFKKEKKLALLALALFVIALIVL